MASDESFKTAKYGRYLAFHRARRIAPEPFGYACFAKEGAAGDALLRFQHYLHAYDAAEVRGVVLITRFDQIIDIQMSRLSQRRLINFDWE